MLLTRRFRAVLRPVPVTALLVVLMIAQADGTPVSSRDVHRAAEGLTRSPSYKLQVVEKLLADLRSVLSQSQTARQRLYYPVGQPNDNYVRFRDLRELCRGLTVHAVEAFRRGDVARAEKALNLAISTMLLMAESPSPPATLYLDGNIPGELSACRPVSELYTSLFFFSSAVKQLLDSTPKPAAILQSVWTRAATAQLIFADAQKQKHLKQLLSEGKYKEYAQECARMRSEMRSALYELKSGVRSAFNEVKR
ncbi:MAG: hypothetical protein NZ749_11310 [bacterium]|nr:hypothetical protein [bacterium]